ncbi:E3 ubiquitin-protein ligase RNF123-like [Chlamydotis macqueenii]
MEMFLRSKCGADCVCPKRSWTKLNGACRVLSGQEKMQDVYWLLRVCIRTIEHGDRTGSLFAFMPEFYLSVAMNSYSALKNYFSPVNSMEELPAYEETLMRLAAILAKHFADSRIVGTDIWDSLMQALASYVCYPHSLRAVERIPEEQRISMMKNLLAPYEQRPWAQTNWILVRLWRGCGFGYRYTRLPHLLKTKPEDASLPSLQRDLSVASFQSEFVT